MKAPKISGEFMTEVTEGDWEYITNGLEIAVYNINDYSDPLYHWSIKYKGHYISEPLLYNADTAQNAANQAVKCLHSLRNIINYIK
jgi:hypothetical protein